MVLGGQQAAVVARKKQLCCWLSLTHSLNCAFVSILERGRRNSLLDSDDPLQEVDQSDGADWGPAVREVETENNKQKNAAVKAATDQKAQSITQQRRRSRARHRSQQADMHATRSERGKKTFFGRQHSGASQTTWQRIDR